MKLDSSTQIKDTKEVFQLVTLTPNKIIKLWEKLTPIIEMFYTIKEEEIDGDVVHDIYIALLSGVLTAYVFTMNEMPLLLILASMTREPGRLRTFFIHALHAFEPINLALWYKILVEIRRFAGDNGCSYVSAKSAHSGFIRLVKNLGGDTNYRYITLEV